MSRSGAGNRLAAWLWLDRGALARLTRAGLLPLAGVYAAVMRIRSLAYRRGWLARRSLALPAVAVGNLSVGGSGKTPLAAWIASWFVARGRRPAVLLRGYGADEPLVHARLVPEAVVVADPDRVAGAERARAAGADVLVLDDAYQLERVRREVDLLVVSAESVRAAPWPLPAGPWREGWWALPRATAIVVTRKRAAAAEALALAERLGRRRPGVPVAVAALPLTDLEGLRTGQRLPLETLRGRRVLVAAGIADPESLAVQVRSAGAAVQLEAYQDHYAFGAADVARLLRSAAAADYVVVTEKDAVKLRALWPPEAREPLVARLGVRWERGEEAVTALLARVSVATGHARPDSSTRTL